MISNFSFCWQQPQQPSNNRVAFRNKSDEISTILNGPPRLFETDLHVCDAIKRLAVLAEAAAPCRVLTRFASIYFLQELLA
jgi:hypothetical protein